MKISIQVIAIFLFLAITGNAQAQTTLPYFSGFDNATQKNGWQQIRKGDVGAYQWNYMTALPFSGTDCLNHNYPVGGTAVTDDWFVSPAFDFSAGGKLDSLRHSFSGFGTPANEDTLAVYLLTGNADPALATSRLLLHDYRGANYNNDNTWHLITNITIPPTPGTSYIAIRYKTVSNWLDVKFDNVRLSSNGTTGIIQPGHTADLLKIYPNPTKDIVSILSKEPIKEIIITDIGGRICYQKPFSTKIDLSSFKNGMYIISCVVAAGNRINLPLVKF